VRTITTAAAALLALVLLAATAATSAAQVNAPALYYGSGLAPGDVVTAHVGGVECASATVGAEGWWRLEVAGDCASDGAEVAFAVNGEIAEQTATWSAGGVPADVANGITLTVAAADDGDAGMDGDGDDDAGMDGDGDDDDDAGMDGDGDGDMTPSPTPPDTGSAGLAGPAGGQGIVTAALALLALAGLAGARTATGRAR